jgi:predicted nucleic acid-binding protein
MTAASFVDTNVWVYAVDDAEPVKRAIARVVLNPAAAATLVVSAQVLGEFYYTVTRTLARRLTSEAAGAMVERMRQLRVVSIDVDIVAAAIAGSRAWQLSYWDALIVAAAQAAGCTRLLTEDLADGAVYGTVRVENPFGDRRRVSEERLPYAPLAGPWDDAGLADELVRYEQTCRDAGMRPNAIHSYWDYARRFLDWRKGDYRPRGSGGADSPMPRRPVPPAPVTSGELQAQAADYARVIEAAGLEIVTVDTYHRHAMFFIRWLRGDFTPGGRLR